MKKKQTTMDRLDLFPAKVPTFNIQGMQHVSSFVGFAFSVVLYLILFGFDNVTEFHILLNYFTENKNGYFIL